jgi:hypothetical protein
MDLDNGNKRYRRLLRRDIDLLLCTAQALGTYLFSQSRNFKVKNNAMIICAFCASYMLLALSATLLAVGNGKCCKLHDGYAGCSGCEAFEENGVTIRLKVGENPARKCIGGNSGNYCIETPGLGCVTIPAGAPTYGIGCIVMQGVSTQPHTIETSQCVFKLGTFSQRN